MKLLYVSCHSILEFEELSLFCEMGYDFFSLGAYNRVEGNPQLPRPGIKGATNHDDLNEIYLSNTNKNEIDPRLIEWADVIIFMGGIIDHSLVENWPRIKHKKVIWRSIGQNTPESERMLHALKDQGLIVVRYSPKEKSLPDYMGEDFMIRFYKDPEDFNAWKGENKQVINISQTLKGRGKNAYYDQIVQSLAGFQAKIFGPGNEDLGNLCGGNPSYDLLRGQLRDNRVYLYGGTWPAPYTLSILEAMMTGIPVVAFSYNIWRNGFPDYKVYEIPELITHGVDGFVADSVEEARSYIQQLMDNDELAHKVSEHARRKAIAIFGREGIKQDWRKLFNKI